MKKFNKSDIKTPDFHAYITKAWNNAVKEAFENFRREYNLPNWCDTYSAVVIPAIGYLGYYKEPHGQQRYGAKAFKFTMIFNAETYNAETDKIVDYIIKEIDDNVNTDEYTDEFEILGYYEYSDDVDLPEYIKHVIENREAAKQKHREEYPELYK